MWCCVFRGCSQRPGIPTLWITHVQASASHAGTAPWWALQIQQQSPFSATLSNAKLAGVSLALALSSCRSYFSICTAKEPSEPPSLRWEALALCAASAWDMVPVVRRDAWHSLVQKSSGRQRGVPAWHAHLRNRLAKGSDSVSCGTSELSPAQKPASRTARQHHCLLLTQITRWDRGAAASSSADVISSRLTADCQKKWIII